MTENQSNLPKAGRYKGKLVDYGAKETAKGDPAIVMRFEFADAEGVTHYAGWQGSLAAGTDPAKKSPRKITFETLEVVGFDFTKNRTLAPVADGLASGCLNTTDEYLLTVELDTYEGKTFPRVRYVNPIGGFKGAIGKEVFAQKMQGLALDADLAQFRSERARAGAAATQPKPAAQNTPSIDDIPF